MLKHLRSLFAPSAASTGTATKPIDVPEVSLVWREDTRWPIPDWDALDAQQPVQEEAQHAWWTAAARQWQQAVAAQWAEGYRVAESRHFLLMSALEPNEQKLLLSFCETARSRLLAYLPGVTFDPLRGKHVVMVIEDPDDYYDYIAHYYPDGGEYAGSSGVFVHAGYGHFGLLGGVHLAELEPVLAHELAHCLVSHLPLPAWLNEGIAVNCEHRMFPQLEHPSAQKYLPAEMAAKHRDHWSAETIQGLWSGSSFHAPDESCMLAYDLAKKLTRLAASDLDAFRVFATSADIADAGLAAESALGYPLQHLVEAVLGPGDWQPRPESWTDRDAGPNPS